MNRNTARGFTLIELLVVIAIIGILSAVVLTSLNRAQANAYDAERVSDLRNIQQALELYASNNNGAYPSSGGAFNSQCATGIVGHQSLPANSVIPGLTPTYISTIPGDPQMNASADTCCYLYKSDGTNYKLMVGYNCSTAGFSNGALTSLLDPERSGAYTNWTLYTGPAQTAAQCNAGGDPYPACW